MVLMQAIEDVKAVTTGTTPARVARVDTQASQQLLSKMQGRMPEALVLTGPQA